jgi:hypothetical protein
MGRGYIESMAKKEANCSGAQRQEDTDVRTAVPDRCVPVSVLIADEYLRAADVLAV